MNRLFDKSIVLACCIAAATGLAVDARLVAAFCLGVIATSLAELAQGGTRPARKRGHELRLHHRGCLRAAVYTVCASRLL